MGSKSKDQIEQGSGSRLNMIGNGHSLIQSKGTGSIGSNLNYNMNL